MEKCPQHKFTEAKLKSSKLLSLSNQQPKTQTYLQLYKSLETREYLAFLVNNLTIYSLKKQLSNFLLIYRLIITELMQSTERLESCFIPDRISCYR